VQTPQELASFGEFLATKNKLAELFDSLIALLSGALANGEPDWKLTY